MTFGLFRWVHRLGFLILITVVLSCGDPAPELMVTEEMVFGEDLELTASGLSPGSTYVIAATKTDIYGRSMSSFAKYIADPCGRIDPVASVPIEGTYDGIDGQGLLWSMIMNEDVEVTGEGNLATFARLQFYLLQGPDTLDIRQSKQWFVTPGIQTVELDGPYRGTVFRPAGTPGVEKGVVLLGGSGGGRSWAGRIAAVLADKGFTALALAYFNEDGLPDHLAEIPLEYIHGAIDDFVSQHMGEGTTVTLIGYSKGAELALLTASQRSDINGVLAFAPASAVFQGFKPPKYPVLSSWTYGGSPIAFVPNNYDKRFFETYDGMYLWYRTLAQSDEMHRAAIKVELINGPILLISGIDDKIWPATTMAEQIMARLKIYDFGYPYDHIAFPFAGHGIAEPPGQPTTSLSDRLGGTSEGNARARREAWSTAIDFLHSIVQ